MMHVLVTVLAFAVAIGVLVTVHEFGHFWVARRLGVKVLRFSVGFGKPLWRRLGRDGTEYVIAALPLGGYVKMLDERETDVVAEEQLRAFNRQSLAVRSAVVVAGPLFNLIFAILAYWVIFMLGVPGIKPVVGEVLPGSPAAIAKFQQQDLILDVNGSHTPTWEAATLGLLEGVVSDDTVAVKVRRQDGQVRTLNLRVDDAKGLTKPGALLKGLGLTLWTPPLPPVVDTLQKGGTAIKAGLKPGDQIIAVDGQKILDWREFAKLLRASPGRNLLLTIKRDGKAEKLQLPVGSLQTKQGRVGHIGVKVRIPPDFGKQMKAEQRYNPLSAMGHAMVRTANMSWLTVEMLYKMVIGDVSWRNISGPINIAQYAGYSASAGLVPFLAFLAIVSISLGVLNLMPVPVLDGGHLLFFGLELVKGAPLSPQAELMGQRIGLTLLLLLMSFAVYNDLTRIFG